MAEVEALDLPTFVVGLADDLSADVEGGEGEEADVELERDGEEGGYIFEVVFVVGVAAQVL